MLWYYATNPINYSRLMVTSFQKAILDSIWVGGGHISRDQIRVFHWPCDSAWGETIGGSVFINEECADQGGWVSQ